MKTKLNDLMERIYLDSSFIIALKVNGHEFNLKAQNILEHLRTDTLFYYSYLTIDECAFTLVKYGADKSQVVELLIELISKPQFYLVNTDANTEELIAYLNTWETTPLKPRDAMHYFYMQQNHIVKIATFDTDFIKNKKKLGIEILR